MTAVTAPQVPARAAAALAALGHELTVHDLYDEVGAPVYHDLAGTDVSEIRELVGILRRVPGPVLELAAGSGRLTLPLLALGREVTALELSDHMLGLLREQLTRAPERLSRRCTLVHGDMVTVTLDRTFPVIVLGTSSVSLLDEAGRAGLYRTVRAHLAPGGRFLLSNVDLPSGNAADVPGAARDTQLDVTGASGRRYQIFEYWPAGARAREVTIVPEVRDGEPVRVCRTSVRVLPTELLERELAGAGLPVRSRTVLPSSGLPHRDVLLEAEADR